MVAAALSLSHALLDGGEWRWWLAAGASAGIALLSKYHGAFLLAGTLLFVATHRPSRAWLRRPQPYAATLLALAIASPVLIWNARHDFASIRFQAGRATTHGLHLAALAQNLAGQIGYLLPWIWLPLAWQLARGLRSGPRDAERWLLTCLAIGPIAVFTLVSLGGNPGLPHWAAPGYLLLFPLAGAAAACYEERSPHRQMLVRRGLTAAMLVFVVLVGIAASDVATGWAARVAPSLFVRGDPSLEAMDWTDLGPALASRGLLPAGEIVAATHWIDASKIGYALGPDHTVICLSDDPRGFAFAYPPSRDVGRDMLILVRSGRGARSVDVPTRYGKYFRAITPADTVPIRRAGRIAITVAAFRAHELLRWP
jgi:hypothetical protein